MAVHKRLIAAPAIPKTMSFSASPAQIYAVAVGTTLRPYRDRRLERFFTAQKISTLKQFNRLHNRRCRRGNNGATLSS
jgi:hypothetical protein